MEIFKTGVVVLMAVVTAPADIAIVADLAVQVAGFLSELLAIALTIAITKVANIAIVPAIATMMVSPLAKLARPMVTVSADFAIVPQNAALAAIMTVGTLAMLMMIAPADSATLLLATAANAVITAVRATLAHIIGSAAAVLVTSAVVRVINKIYEKKQNNISGGDYDSNFRVFFFR
jgi:hypothetical protein